MYRFHFILLPSSRSPLALRRTSHLNGFSFRIPSMHILHRWSPVNGYTIIHEHRLDSFLLSKQPPCATYSPTSTLHISRRCCFYAQFILHPSHSPTNCSKCRIHTCMRAKRIYHTTNEPVADFFMVFLVVSSSRHLLKPSPVPPEPAQVSALSYIPTFLSGCHPYFPTSKFFCVTPPHRPHPASSIRLAVHHINSHICKRFVSWPLVVYVYNLISIRAECTLHTAHITTNAGMGR